jgi:hypothetical protein
MTLPVVGDRCRQEIACDLNVMELLELIFQRIHQSLVSEPESLDIGIQELVHSGTSLFTIHFKSATQRQ